MRRLKDAWIQTRHGAKFYPLQPQIDKIDIRDIAHALAIINRFAGHTRLPLPVADHCLRVASYLPDNLKLAGLLHDASEAYLIDLPTPIKHQMPFYMKVEKRLENMIFKKYLKRKLTKKDHILVKAADKKALIVEQASLMPYSEDTDAYLAPETFHEPLFWKDAEHEFLSKFKEYSLI